jgi:hypothetical protein
LSIRTATTLQMSFCFPQAQSSWLGFMLLLWEFIRLTLPAIALY